MTTPKDKWKPIRPTPIELVEAEERATNELWNGKTVYRSFFSGEMKDPFGSIGFVGVMTVYEIINVIGYLSSMAENSTDHRDDTAIAFVGSGAQVYVDNGVIMLSIPPDDPRRAYNLTIYYTKSV